MGLERFDFLTDVTQCPSPFAKGGQGGFPQKGERFPSEAARNISF